MIKYVLRGEELKKYFESDADMLGLVLDGEVRVVTLEIDNENKTATWHSGDISEADDYEGAVEKIEEIMEGRSKDMLFEKYEEWRMVSEEMLEDMAGSIDCGDKAAREDFSNFAQLENEISFEEMFELEKEYDYRREA